MAHLLGGKVNLAFLRESARSDLRRILKTSQTKKVIVWDESLIGPIGTIAEVPFLLQLGVFKMVRLPASRVADIDQYKEASEFVFFVRPHLDSVDLIREAIGRPNKQKTFTVVFVPKSSIHCIKKFEKQGLVHGQTSPFAFNITEFHLDLLPLEQDLISLDINTAFTDLYIDNDPSPLHQAARAIGRIQAIYGTIPQIYGKGNNAAIVVDLMEKMKAELKRAGDRTEIPPQIDSILLIDRSVDFIASLSTQLTYEGLIDEIYSIKYNNGKFPREMFSEEVQQLPKNAPPPTTPLTVSLTSEDNMYSKLRDLNFGAVGTHLSKSAKDISAQFQERHDAKTVQQLKIFVQKLPHMQQDKLSLSKHTTIAELVKQVTDKKTFLDTIYCEQGLREEDNGDRPDNFVIALLGQDGHLSEILRLMCIHSLANNGLKPKLYDRYRLEIVQRFGTHHLISLHYLEKVGLLKLQEGKYFPIIRKQLRLVTTVDEKFPKDAAYVFSGYAPVTVRIAEILDRPNGWQLAEELLKVIPGTTVSRTSSIAKGFESKKKPTTDHPQIVLVFFLGGCSYAEISALRFLTNREESVTDYIIATTNITTGSKIVNSVLVETPNYKPINVLSNKFSVQAVTPGAER